MIDEKNIPAHVKRRIALRYQLQGRADIDRRWLLALKAFEFAKERHPGFRADGWTPVFDHIVSVSMIAMNLPLPNGIDPIAVVVTALLHDVVEDTDTPLSEIADLFGSDIARHVDAVSKVVQGVKKPIHIYFRELAKDPVASLVKACDRKHNLSTLNTKKKDGSPARRPEKQWEQVVETEEYVLPMMKAARRNFPHLNHAFEMMKSAISAQLDVLRPLCEEWGVADEGRAMAV